MNNTTIHVGLDVHKKTTAIAVSQGPGRAHFIDTIDSNPRALLKVLGKLGDAQGMSVVYEAGSCGCGTISAQVASTLAGNAVADGSPIFGQEAVDGGA